MDLNTPATISTWYRRRGVRGRRAPYLCGCQQQAIQDCFLQNEARVCVSNALVLEDSMFK